MRIFIDTALLIYIIEDHPKFADKTIDLISDLLLEENSFVSSVITILEFCVKPERENWQDVILKFNELLHKLGVEIKIIDEEIAIKVYQLRAKYQF